MNCKCPKGPKGLKGLQGICPDGQYLPDGQGLYSFLLLAFFALLGLCGKINRCIVCYLLFHALLLLKIKLFMDNSGFIRQKGNYEDLLCYKKAVCVYDVTYYFAHKYL